MDAPKLSSADLIEIHGSSAPLDEEIQLRAGHVTCMFEPARGYLRRFRSGGVEVLQTIYLHVRAEDWSTIMPDVKMLKAHVGQDSFELLWEAHSKAPNIDFKWTGSAIGKPDGTIVYRCEGVALGKTVTNRTGVCTLLPASFAGQTVTLTHPDSSKSEVKLPELVSPVEPLANFNQLDHPGGTLVVEGDRYNAEDQRNWTDNSFKIYPICGTRSLYTLEPGDKVTHQVTLRSVPERPVGAVETKLTGNLPAIGTRFVLEKGAPAGAAKYFNFLQLELPTDPTRAENEVSRASEVAGTLRLAVSYRGEKLPEGAEDFERTIFLDVHGGPVGSAAQSSFGARTITGADFFADLNFRGKFEKAQHGVYFGAMPQIHTFDEVSILDNAQSLAQVVASASHLASEASAHAVLQMDFGHDERFASRFGAVWLLSCLAQLSKAESVVISWADQLWPHGKPGHVLHLLERLQQLKSSAGLSATFVEEKLRFEIADKILLANLSRIATGFPAGAPVGGETLTANGWVVSNSQALSPYEIRCYHNPHSK